MKQEYAHLKLIIEVPTQDAWDTVTEFFGLSWLVIDNWDEYSEKTLISIGLDEDTEFTYGYRVDYNDYTTDWERLTYPEFVTRFLEPKPVSLEQVKDAYAQNKQVKTHSSNKNPFKNWVDFIQTADIHYIDDYVDSVATRYASAITEETNARHDKEIVEFYDWATKTFIRYKTGWIYIYQNTPMQDAVVHQTTELLTLFRNRNK